MGNGDRGREKGYGGINGDGRRPDGGGEHILQYTMMYQRIVHLKPI